MDHLLNARHWGWAGGSNLPSPGRLAAAPASPTGLWSLYSTLYSTSFCWKDLSGKRVRDVFVQKPSVALPTFRMKLKSFRITHRMPPASFSPVTPQGSRSQPCLQCPQMACAPPANSPVPTPPLGPGHLSPLLPYMHLPSQGCLCPATPQPLTLLSQGFQATGRWRRQRISFVSHF